MIKRLSSTPLLRPAGNQPRGPLTEHRSTPKLTHAFFSPTEPYQSRAQDGGCNSIFLPADSVPQETKKNLSSTFGSKFKSNKTDRSRGEHRKKNGLAPASKAEPQTGRRSTWNRTGSATTSKQTRAGLENFLASRVARTLG